MSTRFASYMKLQINSWQAVSTWTWNASDDTCGICRQAFDGFVHSCSSYFTDLLRFGCAFCLFASFSRFIAHASCSTAAALTANFPAMIALSVRLR